MINHPSEQFIKYLYIVDKDVKKILKKYNIYVPEDFLKKFNDLRRIKDVKMNQKQIMFYLKKFGLETLHKSETKRTIAKIVKNTSNLFFLHTAIYRGIMIEEITNILNSRFYEIENNLSFQEEDIALYKEFIFNPELCSEEDLEELYNLHKQTFDFANKKDILEIQVEAGLIPDTDPYEVVNHIQSTNFALYKRDIMKRNTEKREMAMKHAEQALKAAKLKMSLEKEDGSEKIFDKIIMNFNSDKEEIPIKGEEESY